MRHDVFPQRLSGINHFVYISGNCGTLWKESVILLDSSVYVCTVYETVEIDSNNKGFQSHLEIV